VTPLGKGGMSRVYKAYDRVLGEAVAIKVLRAELAWEAEMRQRFMHEIRLARRVSHPNVCRIHEYGEDGAVRFISMELVDGVNLKDVLRNRGLSTEEAFDLALQLSDGLQAVHQHGIIHRDTKASNVMVDRQGVTKLMDFGIAKQAEAETSGFTTPGQVLGTPEYMSPEHARGGKIDFRSDLYALGCVLFEIFTGQAPFRGPNAFATISKHFYEPAPLEGPLAALIPEPLVPVLRTALAKEPSRRYASMADMRDALRQAQRLALGDAVTETRGSGVGSARLARLCEALLARAGPPSGAGEDSSASISATPRIAAAKPAPSPPPAAVTAPTPRPPRGRALLTGALLAALVLAAGAWTVRVWPASGGGAEPSASPVPTAAGAAQPAPTLVAPTPEPPPAVEPTATAVAVSPPPVTPARVRQAAGELPLRAVAPVPSPRPTPPMRAAAGPAPTLASAAPRAEPARPAPRVDGGTLRILVVPAAEVVIDGASVGSVSLREIALAAGPHTVRVQHPDYLPLNRKVTIQAGAVSELLLDLAEKGVRRNP
jgi:serine/threonine-protein kinase